VSAQQLRLLHLLALAAALGLCCWPCWRQHRLLAMRLCLTAPAAAVVEAHLLLLLLAPVA
jgi:hypothetical protein